MVVYIGTTTANPFTVGKNPSLTQVDGVVPYGDIDLLQPNLLLDYTPERAKCNYMYVPDWGRYYFIGNIRLISGSKMIVPGRVDVLESYKEGILDLDVYIERSTSGKADTLPDGNIPIDTKTSIHNLLFSETPFGKEGAYVLTVLGG